MSLPHHRTFKFVFCEVVANFGDKNVFSKPWFWSFIGQFFLFDSGLSDLVFIEISSGDPDLPATILDSRAVLMANAGTVNSSTKNRLSSVTERLRLP